MEIFLLWKVIILKSIQLRIDGIMEYELKLTYSNKVEGLLSVYELSAALRNAKTYQDIPDNCCTSYFLR